MADGDCSHAHTVTEDNDTRTTRTQLEELSSIHGLPELPAPSDVIVQEQLRDVILLQRTAVEQLHQSITGQESFIKDHLVSREEHFSKLKDLEETLQEKFVPKEDYVAALQKLEAEQQAHAQTKLKLMEVTDKLDFTLSEVEILNKQLAKEKEAFQQITDSMRSQIAKTNSWNEQLSDKYTVSQKQCQELEARLASREDTITSLEQRLASQQKRCERKIEELEVERQQDQYVARMMDQPKNSRAKNSVNSKLSASTVKARR